MNHTALTDWFVEHHPSASIEPARWANTLPGDHTPAELADALATWHGRHPSMAPHPADIASIISRARTDTAAATTAAGIRRDLAEKRERELPSAQAAADRMRRRIRTLVEYVGVNLDDGCLVATLGDQTLVLTPAGDGHWTDGRQESETLGDHLWRFVCTSDLATAGAPR